MCQTVLPLLVSKNLQSILSNVKGYPSHPDTTQKRFKILRRVAIPGNDLSFALSYNIQARDPKEIQSNTQSDN